MTDLSVCKIFMANDSYKWHQRFAQLAQEVSTWSKDPSTKVGCILVRDKKVVSTGYNGLPRSISDSFERLNDRSIKYEITIHAEQNAVISAALHGVSTVGCAAYVTFNPCSRCSAVLINAGIETVYVSGYSDIPERWVDNFIIGAKLLEEAGIPLKIIDVDC